MVWFHSIQLKSDTDVPGWNNREAADAVVTSVLFEPLHDLEQKLRAVLLFCQIQDEYHAAIHAVPDKASLTDFMDSEHTMIHTVGIASIGIGSGSGTSNPVCNPVCRQLGFKVFKAGRALEMAAFSKAPRRGGGGYTGTFHQG